MGNGPTMMGHGKKRDIVTSAESGTGHEADMPLGTPIDPRGDTTLLGSAPDLPNFVIEATEGFTENIKGMVLDNRYCIHNILKRIDAGGSIIGEGGMGTVFLAEDLRFEAAKVAVKIMHGNIARTDEQISRFIAEANTLASLGNENIVRVIDRGQTPDGRLYFVMEYVKGKSLAQVREAHQRPFTWEETRLILLQICNAIHAAHENKIVHRDLKPENILLVDRGSRPYVVKVLDFGIAKRTDLDSGQKKLTQTGMIFGTALYMSPEQARGKSADYRSDIYSLGIIMYEMLTGKVPFGDTAGDVVEILLAHATQPPQPLKEANPNADVSKEIESIIFKALEKDPNKRFQSMLEIEQAIQSAQPTKQSPTLVGLAALEEPGRETIAIKKDIVRGTRRLLFIITCLIVAAAGGAGIYYLIGNSNREPKKSAPFAPKPDAGMPRPTQQQVRHIPAPVKPDSQPGRQDQGIPHRPDQGIPHRPDQDIPRSPDQTPVSTLGTSEGGGTGGKPKPRPQNDNRPNADVKRGNDPKLNVLKDPKF